ncbi:MAG TPA: hypothetical protein DCE41_15575 [Cytophagales bacterium]|nr:hypothetical protein [Cytophagales bacterium]
MDQKPPKGERVRKARPVIGTLRLPQGETSKGTGDGTRPKLPLERLISCTIQIFMVLIKENRL